MSPYNSLFKMFDFFAGYSDSLGLILAFICIIFKYNKIDSPSKRWIFLFYLIFSFSTLSTTALIFLLQNNTWLYNSIPFLIVVPLFFFFQQLHDSKYLLLTNKLFILIYLSIAVIFWKFIFQTNLNPFFYMLFSFYILFNSVGYLNEEMTSMRSQNVFAKTEFWFITCLFFYATICVIVWSLFSYLQGNITAQKKYLHPYHLWLYGHNLVLFIQCFVFSIAIFKTTKGK